MLNHRWWFQSWADLRLDFVVISTPLLAIISDTQDYLDIVGIRRRTGACLKQEQSNQSKDPTGLVIALFELFYLKGSND